MINQRTRAEIARGAEIQNDLIEALQKENSDLQKERDALQQDVERLRADAARYQFIRQGNVYVDPQENGVVYAAIDSGDYYHARELDMFIDAAISDAIEAAKGDTP